jgi:hypothetical protein
MFFLCVVASWPLGNVPLLFFCLTSLATTTRYCVIFSTWHRLTTTKQYPIIFSTWHCTVIDMWYCIVFFYMTSPYLSQPHFGQVWGWNSHSQSWGLGVLRDSRMFRVRQQGEKDLALGCSWFHWKGLEV